MAGFAVDDVPEAHDVRDLLRRLVDLIYANMDRVQQFRYEINWKADGSPVTAADVFLEDLIHRFLVHELPSVTFAGEESFREGDPAHSDGIFAILDPIDGTENFCSGLKEWGTALTLWHGGTHLGSLLLLPELGEHLMSGDRPPRLTSRIHGFSSSMCQELLDGMAQTRESRLTGCAAYNLYNVARGAFAQFTNPRGAYAWDLLPGLMLALENQCDVLVEGAPYHGHFLEPGRKYSVDIRHRYDLHPGQGALDRQG